MSNLIIDISKYLMIFLFAFYTYEGFASLRRRLSQEKKNRILSRQSLSIYLIHGLGYLSIYIATDEDTVLIFYVAQFIFFKVLQNCYQLIYENTSRLVTNNLCMLLCIGFIMLTRLSFDKALKQFLFAVVSVIVSLVIPVCIRKVGFVRKMYWLFAGVGIVLLAVVAIAGRTSYGAKLSISIAGFSLQPSEFIKILFVFFVAGMLYENTSFKRVCITTALAATHVLILVLSRDLGGALIFFIAYLVMLYVATRNVYYFGAGILSGVVASIVGYHLFSHVQVRVLAWQNPLSVIDNEGYQVSQSLFAIGTGSWFGMGLYQGLPNKIPVVEQDFIFSAIAEELGGIFAICLIMVCITCFLMFLNIAMQMKDQFYKLVALGLGTVYGFQVILTIGGAIKFIPSTGVTLPLVSYGGSSLVSSMMIFAIIQGLYILRQDENNSSDKEDGAKGEVKTNGKRTGKKTQFDTEIERFS